MITFASMCARINEWLSTTHVVGELPDIALAEPSDDDDDEDDEEAEV